MHDFGLPKQSWELRDGVKKPTQVPPTPSVPGRPATTASPAEPDGQRGGNPTPQQGESQAHPAARSRTGGKQSCCRFCSWLGMALTTILILSIAFGGHGLHEKPPYSPADSYLQALTAPPFPRVALDCGRAAVAVLDSSVELLVQSKALESYESLLSCLKSAQKSIYNMDTMYAHAASSSADAEAYLSRELARHSLWNTRTVATARKKAEAARSSMDSFALATGQALAETQSCIGSIPSRRTPSFWAWETEKSCELMDIINDERETFDASLVTAASHIRIAAASTAQGLNKIKGLLRALNDLESSSSQAEFTGKNSSSANQYRQWSIKFAVCEFFYGGSFSAGSSAYCEDVSKPDARYTLAAGSPLQACSDKQS